MMSRWLEQELVEPGSIIVCDKDVENTEPWASMHGLRFTSDPSEAVNDAATVVLAVKPQDYKALFRAVATVIPENVTILSIVAGVTVDDLRKAVGENANIVRVMPNMGALQGASVSAYCIERANDFFDSVFLTNLLEAIGTAVEVDESELDLVTAVSGSGPAYFFLLTDELEKAAIDLGASPALAGVLARETLWGAACVLHNSTMQPGELVQAVASPGGTTMAALEVFRRERFSAMVGSAVKAARDRANELAK